MLKIGLIYPEILNYSGDLGNLVAIKKRLEESKIEYEVIDICVDDSIDFSDYHLVFFPSGKEIEIKIAKSKINEYYEGLKDAVESGVVIFATGNAIKLFDQIFDFEIISFKKKIQPTVIETSITGQSIKILGYEKSNYRIKGITTPLGKVLNGYGNDSKYEGLIYKNTLLTNLYGPILIKNPELLDFILDKAISISNSKQLISCEYALERKARLRILSELGFK